MIAFIHSSEPAPGGAAARRVQRWLAAARVDAAALDQSVLGPGAAIEWPGAVLVESAGASATTLRSCRSLLGRDAFLVIDVARFEEFELRGLVAEHASSPAIATLLLRPATGAPLERRADVDRTGRILRLALADAAPELTLATSGVALIEPDLLQHVPADPPMDLESGLFPLVLRHGGILSGWRVIDGGQGSRPRARAGAGS